MKKPKKSDIRELNRISKSIPSEYMKNLEIEVDTTPAMKEMFERASKDMRLTPEQRRQAKIIHDSGFWAKKHKIVNKDVEKKINDYLEREIEKSKKLGLLSSTPITDALKNKVKKHAKKRAN